MRGALTATLALVLVAWSVGPRLTADLTPKQSSDRMARFVTKLTPKPAQPADKFAPAGERGAQRVPTPGLAPLGDR